MARQNRVAQWWNRLDRTVRNTIDPRNWGQAVPWNRQSTELSTSMDFDLVDLQPREHYKGQLFASIRTRANKVADMAKEHVETRLFDDPEEDVEETHPYLTLINESPKFTNTFFWKSLSTYLDLPGGMAYVFVLRSFAGTGLRGQPKEFQVINPYTLTKVSKGSDREQYRYVEMRSDGAWREIPEEQLIIMRSFNPFEPNSGYGISEAATEDQYSVNQARSYSRQAVRDNVGQRGMLSPSVVLQDEAYKNFEQAIVAKSRTGKGKFLTTNAPINYTDMQVDLDKLALETINKISHETITSVTGASKTILAIEQSGVTRETSNVQRDMFSEFHVIPQLNDIIDALNQDYKNSYPKDYATKKLELYIDSPLKVDKDRELKEAQIDKTKAEAAKVLIETGYSAESVNEFLEIENLEFEERQPKGLPVPAGTLTPTDKPDEQPEEDVEEQRRKEVLNKFSPGLEQVVKGFETTLTNQVANIEGQVLHAVIPKLGDKFAVNAVSDEEAEKTLSKQERERLEKELATAFNGFWTAMVSLFGGQTTSKRITQFGLPGEFTFTKEANTSIKKMSQEVAKTHVATFVKASYKAAADAALEGLAREAIVSRLTSQFPRLAKWQATRIATDQTYRAINFAQHEADRLFIKQNNLTGRVYKVWHTQSSNPCPFCLSIEGKKVPFNENFLDIGDSVKAEFIQKSGVVTREMVVSYAPAQSGNLHVQCHCSYELVVDPYDSPGPLPPGGNKKFSYGRTDA